VNSLPFLDSDALRCLVSTQDAIAIVRGAYEEYGRGGEVLSRPSAMQLKPAASPFAFKLKGGFSASEGVAGFRLAGFGPAGLVSHCIVLDAETGLPLGLVDETWLHRLRTAASSALAARWLARSDARVLAIVGAGQIATEIPAAFAHLFQLDEIRITSRSLASAQALARHCETFAATTITASIDDAVVGADIVVSVTSATEPLLHGRHFVPGITVIGLGGNAEIDRSALDVVDTLIVDDLEFAMEAGSIAGWLRSGESAERIAARVDAHIGEIAAGTKAARRSAEGMILAIVQGMAHCDVALAAFALRKAARP